VERNDHWGIQIKGRLQSCNDLVAEEALYHHLCYFRFTQNRSSEPESTRSGRRTDPEMAKAFEDICHFLESSCESLYSLSELRCEFESSEVYSNKHLKRKLKEKYGDHVFFAEVNGRPDVICFRDMSSYIISDKWYEERKSSTLEESERIVCTAGKLIAAAVCNMNLHCKQYPSASDITDSAGDKMSHWVPHLMNLFMKELVSSNTKRSAICQTIVQAGRPRRAIMPIPLGLAISIDNICGSSQLVMETARLGFCLSYDELLRFK